MAIWDRLKKPVKSSADIPSIPQTRDTMDSLGFSFFENTFAEPGQIKLYRAIRKQIPIIDTAIKKHIRLRGDFEIQSKDAVAKKLLDDFKRDVRVNWFGKGISDFQNEIDNEVRTTGMFFGEAVLTQSGKQIHRLKTCKTEDFAFQKNDVGEIILCAKTPDNLFMPVPLKYQDLIYYITYDQFEGRPEGISMLYSLPFVYQIMVRILKTWDNAIWRNGELINVIVYKGGPNDTPKDGADTVNDVASQVATSMVRRKQGQTSDIIRAIPPEADLKITTLGTDGKFFSTELPYKSILEQVVSVTHLPPTLLGAHWALAETMIDALIDILVTEINWVRKKQEITLRRIFDLHLILNNKAGAKYELVWNTVNLQDRKVQADARFTNAQAEEKELANLMTLQGMGLNKEYDKRIIALGGVSKSAMNQELLKDHFARKIARELE